jgi:hypothetical protein
MFGSPTQRLLRPRSMRKREAQCLQPAWTCWEKPGGLQASIGRDFVDQLYFLWRMSERYEPWSRLEHDYDGAMVPDITDLLHSGVFPGLRLVVRAPS